MKCQDTLNIKLAFGCCFSLVLPRGGKKIITKGFMKKTTNYFMINFQKITLYILLTL